MPTPAGGVLAHIAVARVYRDRPDHPVDRRKPAELTRVRQQISVHHQEVGVAPGRDAPNRLLLSQIAGCD
jgi:hypothetical protein